MDEQIFQTVHRLRKSGNLAEAWDIGCPAVQKNPNDQYLKGSFFWVCYAYLKEVQSNIKSRADNRNGDHTPSPSELDRINFLVDWIIWLNIPSGGYEYRSLLLISKKNLVYIPKLVLLLIRCSDSLFTDEDKQPFVNENGESPSLMLKFARIVAESWRQNESVRQLPVDDLCSLFSITRQQANDKQQKIWLDYDEAKCLIIAKRFDQARDCALSVLRKKQTESWAWEALATTYREEDPCAAIVLFSKALCYAKNDVFALPTLKSIALFLADQGFTKEASMCLKRAVNCYLENGWNIKSDLEQLISQPWYDADVDLELLKPFLEKHAVTALDYLFGEREQSVAVVQNVHASGKGFHAYLNRNQSVSVRLGLYRSKKPPNPGDYVRLTLSKEDQSVVAAEPCDPVDIDDVGYKEGTLSIKEKGFGFVEDTFVPKPLAEPEMDGQSVKVLRILDFDKTKSRHGWKALTIEVF